MRNLLAAGLALTAALAAGAAAAQSSAGAWTDPNNKITFERPAGWPVDIVNSASPGTIYVISGTADIECQFVGLESPSSAGRSVASVRTAYANPLPAAAWTQMTGGLRIFRNGAELTSQTVDTSGFWPIQRAVFRSGESTIYAAMQGRPGYELRTFCLTYDGSDGQETFNRVISSVGTPQDDALEAQFAASQAPAAPAAPPAQ